MTKKSSSSKGEPSFEAQLARLEEIRDQLEAGDLGLDDAIKLYEEGVAQLRLCQKRLAGFEARIEELTALQDAEPENDGEAE